MSERDFVASEVSELEALLRHIPEGNVIERMGLEERLAEKRKELGGMDKGYVVKATDYGRIVRANNERLMGKTIEGIVAARELLAGKGAR